MVWTDRQKIPDPEHPIPTDPPRPDDPYRRGPRHIPRAVTIVALTVIIVAALIVLGMVTQVISF